MTFPNVRISNGLRTYALQIFEVHWIGFLCFNFALRVMLLLIVVTNSSQIPNTAVLFYLASEHWLHFFKKKTQAISNFSSFYFMCFIVANYLKSLK